MKRTLLFLTALLMMVGNGIVKADNIQVSTILPGNGTPEHGYTMQTAPNTGINGNRFVGENLTPSEGDSDKAYLVFYKGDKGENSYYIYNYSQSKWLYVTGLSNDRDRISTTDNKSDASQFYITSVSGREGYYQLQPYNGNSPASFYVNYFQGFDDNNAKNNKLGLWRDNGNSDSGSAWIFAEVTLPIHELTAISPNKVYTLTPLGTKNYLDGVSDEVNRGRLYAGENAAYLTTTTDNNLDPKNNVGLQFAFISTGEEGKFYLYSLGAQKFVHDNGEQYAPMTIDRLSTVVLREEQDNFFSVKLNGTECINASTGWNHGVVLNWNTIDGGNQFEITPVDGVEFDPSSTLPQASQELIDKARAALEKTGLGYPKSDCQTRANLSSILEDDAPQKEELTNALNAFLTSTNIQLPEDGKAYTFNIVHKDGTKFYLKYVESGMIYQSNEDAATPFVCRTLDNGKFAFVNNDGKYLVWKGNLYGYNGNKGYTDSYNTDGYTDIDIKRIYKSSYVNVSDEELFGLMVFSGKNNKQEDQYTNIGTNGDYQNAPAPYYIDGYSSAIQMTEVSYPNTVTLASFEGSQLITNLEGNTIGTFSAPFPTLISNGNVVAYYAEHVEGTEYVKLRAIATTAAIPANEGVILVGTTAETTSVLMVPATSEQQADLTSNLFSNSAGHKADMREGDFILARGSQGIGFYPVNIDNNGTEGTTLAMNKAFLRMGTSNVAAFRLVVDEEVTAIDGVTTEKADAPIYDLSGRRVLNTIKGGIYIQNGKKFIVK